MRTVNIFHITRRDLATVLDIERKCFDFPWTEAEFMRCLKEKNNRGIVARVNESPVGYAICNIQLRSIRILNMAVHPNLQRRKVGKAMFGYLASYLSHKGPSRIDLHVRETNLDAQLFFKSLGAKAFGVFRDFYEGDNESAYLMQYRLEPTNEELTAVKNRMSKYLDPC
ncbi:ribosomal-protein-alanine N-acetyltransferase [Novipirellula galeiformis]|uniref:Ribosomal-protein-alanine N-acetyltransferase n=1 Tax=Novipirellula galeiformis TaxID=2528004 RepID=A0A5C6CFG7_9BACT|nr:ribosomal protein S18-alanine N-acetyltransferase [Novipirellula galeiformis]TWU22487.1 ribosomal-protein-alanine N-acetyltransferase [Novipirellula galeiformis]